MKNIYFILFLSVCFMQMHAQQTEKIYLSGTGKDDAKSWEFFCTAGMNSGKCTTIAVPSCWELQDFGKYNYGFDKDSLRGKEQGLYKYNFDVPSSWQHEKIRIVFEGSMTDTEVKINGKSAGVIHQGSFYAFKYDITRLLKFGQKNLLEVTVSKHSANASVNAAERKADFWIFGGIFRPVFLEALPETFMESIAINAKADGSFSTSFLTNGTADKATVQIYNADGSLHGKVVTVQIKSGNVFLSNKFSTPKLWSPEFPNLYKAVFTIYKNGKSLHTLSQKFGFRTVEVKQRDGIYVNGVKVKMKGVNRHSFWPTSGRTTSRQISIEDVLLMKSMNMNAVRMSHYPPDDHFLDACDSLGLFVMDELAGWHGNYDTPTGTKLVKEMLVHDVNHPSIIFWSNGNEGGHNLELDHLFGENDIQHRPVVHPWQLFGGFETQHYREYNYGIGNYNHGHDIVMPTEFLHGLYDGGHGAGLEDYWEAMWKDPLSAGGFLWDFADAGVVRTDKGGMIDTDGNHGADGIVGPYHEKEGSYFAIKEIWSPIHFEHREITAAFDGAFTIENRYHFTNLNQCKFSWKLVKLNYTDTGIVSSINGKTIAPNAKAGEKASLKISLPKLWQQYDVLLITVTGVDGKEIFTWSFPITHPAAVVKAALKFTGSKKIQLTENDSAYLIRSNGVSIDIKKSSGLLLKVENDKGIIPFNNGPIIQEGISNFQNFTHRFEGEHLIIESTFDKKKSYNTLQWTIFPSGIIRMQVNYFPAEYFTSFMGVNFSFPEKEMKGVQYMGNGPNRVWKNRMKGNQFGTWNKTYNNTETGEAWVYPEFKGYHSNMYWCKFLTTGQPFTVYTENEDLFFRLFTPAWKTDQWHNYEPTFPTGDISFMQGISSIGTKTQRNETTGPMGMKNIFYDYEKDPVRALSLVLYFDFSAKDK
ncbi:MAG: glycoside hydrolase family 2 sugar binding [Ferruginibacter sp.]|nr:glycoside hydrolase family 2 sugar binding [Ferruginibacter sp.]